MSDKQLIIVSMQKLAGEIALEEKKTAWMRWIEW